MSSKPTKKSFEGQYDDEGVELVFRQHPIVLRKPLLVLLGLLVISLLPFTVRPTNINLLYAVPIGFVAGFFVLGYAWIGWYFSVYILTDQRLIQIRQKGFFNRQVVELGLDKIQNVNFDVSGIQATILRFGTIVVQTFVGDLVIDKVHRPERVHRQVSDVIRHVQYTFEQSKADDETTTHKES